MAQQFANIGAKRDKIMELIATREGLAHPGANNAARLQALQRQLNNVNARIGRQGETAPVRPAAWQAQAGGYGDAVTNYGAEGIVDPNSALAAYLSQSGLGSGTQEAPAWWDTAVGMGMQSGPYVPRQTTMAEDIGAGRPGDPLSDTHMRAVMLGEAIEYARRSGDLGLLAALQAESQANRAQRAAALGGPSFVNPTNFMQDTVPGEGGEGGYVGTGPWYSENRPELSEQDIMDWFAARTGGPGWAGQRGGVARYAKGGA